jgi:hypothetical protein
VCRHSKRLRVAWSTSLDATVLTRSRRATEFRPVGQRLRAGAPAATWLRTRLRSDEHTRSASRRGLVPGPTSGCHADSSASTRKDVDARTDRQTDSPEPHVILRPSARAGIAPDQLANEDALTPSAKPKQDNDAKPSSQMGRAAHRPDPRTVLTVPRARRLTPGVQRCATSRNRKVRPLRWRPIRLSGTSCRKGEGMRDQLVAGIALLRQKSPPERRAIVATRPAWRLSLSGDAERKSLGARRLVALAKLEPTVVIVGA